MKCLLLAVGLCMARPAAARGVERRGERVA